MQRFAVASARKVGFSLKRWAAERVSWMDGWIDLYRVFTFKMLVAVII